MKLLSPVLLISILVCAQSYGGERFEYFTGVRQMGMGGAGVATVNDETSLLTNPAGLARLRDMIGTIFDPEITGGEKNSSIYGTNTLSGLTSMQGLLDATKLKPGEHWNAKTQLMPSFVVPNFGMGLFAKYEYNAEVDTTGTDFRVDYFNDYAFLLGYAIRLFDGRIKFGFTGKLMNRVQVNETLPATSTGLDFKDYAYEAGAAGIDAGLIITMPWDWLPTIAATVHDAGNTTFNQGTGYFYKPANRPPPMLMQTVDAAFALFPIHSNSIRSTITAEYRDVSNKYEETDSARKVHAGIEINFGDTFFVRGGMNQRYWTAGFELSMPYVQFQLASYGEEIGTATAAATVLKEDRRYIGKFSFRF